MSRPAPNPNSPGYTPGITSAGAAGQFPPELQGVPVPLPPAPAGARTEAVQGPSNPFPPSGVLAADLPGPPPPGVPVPVGVGGH